MFPGALKTHLGESASGKYGTRQWWPTEQTRSFCRRWLLGSAPTHHSKVGGPVIWLSEFSLALRSQAKFQPSEGSMILG